MIDTYYTAERRPLVRLRQPASWIGASQPPRAATTTSRDATL